MDWLSGSKKGEINRLINLLSDSKHRDAAIEELTRRGMESTPNLIAALQTEDQALVSAIQQILVRIPGTESALVSAFQSAHPIVRGWTAEILGRRRDQSTIPILLSGLDSEFFTVRAKSALALAEIQDPSIISNLLPLLRDPQAMVRSAACTAVGSFRNPETFDEIANVLLEDQKIEVRQSAVRSLAEARHPAVIPFLMDALRDSFWWYEREQAVSVLFESMVKMGELMLDPLLEALEDPERTVRKFSAMLLGRIGHPRAIEPLANSLYDLHHEVGRAAAEALASFGSEGLDPLLEALRHPEVGVRSIIVEALANVQDARVAPELIRSLADPDRGIRKLAIQFLTRAPDPRALSALQGIAADRSDRELSTLAKQALAAQQAR
jgi:HEAT repeat protein